ncbi:MAG: sigma-70 family RNA polymerase sigma factor [Reichenbachiella sp.]|uniref:RNA polymerase sigma factor n=1 Tax=Reichenbachiella sp. TaxID=2184521 RepID=UPI0032644830
MAKERNIFERGFDLESFKQFFDDHFTEIKNFIYYKTSAVDISEDLAQECFLKVWERREKINPETAKNYLYTVAKNLAVDHIKKQKSFFTFINKKQKTDDGETPLYVLEEKEFDQQLQKAIADLTEKQRVVFLMNRIDDLTYKEIAGRLGLSVKAVEKRMMQALKLLKEQIAQKI